jgi:hypothetical protein
MTREERNLEGIRVSGSDHLTAYNLFAEAVNRHGYLGEVYGLPRQLFDEKGLAEWAETRGALVKAIEDIALGTASVYRALELPLPEKLPYAGRELREAWTDLVARIMPFDLVLDEQTADGQEARISRNSVAGSWGAVAGTLRFFADRFGTPRAAIEGTTLPYDLIRRYARRGRPAIEVSGSRRHQGLVARQRLTYFGFQLDAVVEPLDDDVPGDLLPLLADALAGALLAGETVHPSQGRVRRAAAELGELWRRSGGTLAAANPVAVRAALAAQLMGVRSWRGFLATPVALDPTGLVPEGDRSRLAALPAGARVLGDMIPIRYEVTPEGGIARLELREGQARRVTAADLPRLDRPLHFSVVRGSRESLQAATLEELRAVLRDQGERERRRRFKPPRNRR